MFWNKNFYFILIIVAASCKPVDDPVIVEDEMVSDNFLFASDETGKFEVWSHIDGVKEQLTVDNEFNNWWPKINPSNSDEALYISTPADKDIKKISQSDVHITNIKTGLNQIVFDANTSDWTSHATPDWSNDGKMLVMSVKSEQTTRWQILVCDRNGDNQRIISTRASFDYLDPVFAPGDSTIICAVVPEEEVPNSQNYELFEIYLDSNIERRLTFNEVRDQNPVITENGKTVLFESLKDPNYLTIGKWVIDELDMNTGEVETLIENRNLNLSPALGKNNEIFFVQLDITKFSTGLLKYDRNTKTISTLLDDEFSALNIAPILD